MTHDRRMTGWLEKTPRHLHFVKYIKALVPGSFVIHIVRNGPDAIASLYQATQQFPQGWGGARDLDVCIHRWLSDVERSRAQVGKPGQAFIRYDDLLRAPDTTLTRLCSDVGISFERTMLVDYRDAARLVQLPSEHWKRGTTNAIGGNERHKFEQILTAEQQRLVLDRIAHFEVDRWFPTQPEQSADAIGSRRQGAS